ncbi:uncharacterized protein [Rutidosis leptorrhynchoides]|uniref:uncharacterized protein n=1 Tax=Rutidosis leptorrhynchoides TaxID=125765 RepID=UPI003A9A5A0F
MADSSSSHSFNKTHFQDPNPSSFSPSVPTKPQKIFSYFPSQVPDYFKKSTIINKIWELIYLLVIGIVVCYGLFSRKTDIVHGSDTLGQNYDNFAAKETYLSGISNISSIFEDGVQGFDGFNEKDLFQQCKGIGSSVPEFGNANASGKCDRKKMNQYFLGDSLVVIKDEKYVLEQLGKPKMLKQSKPLCLPVRNLGSKRLVDRKSFVKQSPHDENNVIEQVRKPKTVKEKEPACLPAINLGSKRGLVPINLEEKFKETISDSNSDSDTQTSLNWRSKSMRLEKQEDMCATEVNETSHFRNLSVGVHDFEGLKSQSMRFSMPSQMKNHSEKEELNVMESKIKVDGITSNVSSKDSLIEVGKIKVNHALDSNNIAPLVKSKTADVLEKEAKFDSSNVVQKPASIVTTYKKGKSVRTKRPKEQVLEAKVQTFISPTDDKFETRSKMVTSVKADELSDAEPHSGEVDRKAEEFIAKFKEQIRLQKVASARKLNVR